LIPSPHAEDCEPPDLGTLRERCLHRAPARLNRAPP
jgi:hypothetical protein